MSFIKKYCYLAIIASSGLSASEIPSRQWEKVLGDFFTWATPNPNNLTKTIKKLEQANPIDALQEQEKYNKLSALYEQLAETNYRGRGQNNQYQACKTKAVENKKKAEALETTICELKIEQEMKPYEDEITEILNECKTENKTSAWIATIPYYEELLKIADRSHHRNRDFYCDQLTELHKLKLRKEIHEQLPELKRSNNKEKLLQTYSMLLNTSTTDEYTKKIQRNIDSLKSEIEIEQIRNNLETNIACIAQSAIEPTAAYVSVLSYCSRLEKSSNQVAQGFAQEKITAYKALLMDEYIKADPEITKNEFILHAFRSVVAECPASDIDSISTFVSTFTIDEAEQEVQPSQAAHSELTAAVLATKQAMKIAQYKTEEMCASMSAKIEDQITAAQKATYPNEAEKCAALANAVYQRTKFYEQYYPETKKQEAAEAQKLAINNTYRALSRNQSIKPKINPDILALL